MSQHSHDEVQMASIGGRPGVYVTYIRLWIGDCSGGIEMVCCLCGHCQNYQENGDQQRIESHREPSGEISDSIRTRAKARWHDGIGLPVTAERFVQRDIRQAAIQAAQLPCILCCIEKLLVFEDRQ